MMVLVAVLLGVAALVTGALVKHARDRVQFEEHSITPEDLHRLLAADRDVSLFDVRHPLDVLANSVVIPGATQIAPEEVIAHPALIPKDRDSILYCTCPSDKTSQVVMRRALAMGFLRVKFLKGGLESWQAMGYPVERYDKPFHLRSSDAALSR
jgi:rhodanese-related sulfurtransferase